MPRSALPSLALAFVALTLVALLVPPALAEPDATDAERAAILAIEMRRGPARGLEPFLEPERNALTRQLAIRALGRIGDYGGAPEVLKKLIARGGEDLPLVLWSAGITRSEELGDAVLEQLKSTDARVLGAAAHALGWINPDGAARRLSALLLHVDADIRAEAIVALARVGSEGHLERIVRFVHAGEQSVREAAAYACWILSSMRKGAALARNKEWDGDPALCQQFVPLLRDRNVDRRLAGIRPLGSLLPKQPQDAGGDLAKLVNDPEPRVVQEAIRRIYAPRKNDWSTALLEILIDHDDPKVRRMAAETLGSRKRLDPLKARFGREPDDRMREVLAVESARCGDYGPWEGLRKGKRARLAEEPLRQLTDARVALLKNDEESLGLLFEVSPKLHPVVNMEVLQAIGERDDKWVERFVDYWIKQSVRDPARVPVVATAISIAGEKRMEQHLDTLEWWIGPWTELPPYDVRQAAVGALGEFLKQEDFPGEKKERYRALVRERMYADPSAFVRATAREVAKEAGFPPESEDDPFQPNDWRGLPGDREGEWLDEVAIVSLARHLREQNPTIRFETTAGPFTVELDFEAAPVHAVSLVLAVKRGLYTGTRWHRVVPNFVIQGGDPTGTGAGGGGWTVPDEISTLPYVRGALGMPKSVKDDGGCQLFFMHTRYPLDERYTNYGRVTGGMDTVDRIRVGDRILVANILVGGKGEEK